MSNGNKANSPVSEDRDGEYLSAKEAAKALGITVPSVRNPGDACMVPCFFNNRRM